MKSQAVARAEGPSGPPPSSSESASFVRASAVLIAAPQWLEWVVSARPKRRSSASMPSMPPSERNRSVAGGLWLNHIVGSRRVRSQAVMPRPWSCARASTPARNCILITDAVVILMPRFRWYQQPVRVSYTAAVIRCPGNRWSTLARNCGVNGSVQTAAPAVPLATGAPATNTTTARTMATRRRSALDLMLPPGTRRRAARAARRRRRGRRARRRRRGTTSRRLRCRRAPSRRSLRCRSSRRRS